MRARDRERVLLELQSRVVEETSKAGRVEEALADAVYHEQRRLKEDRSKTRDEELGFWRNVQGEALPPIRSSSNQGTPNWLPSCGSP